MTTPRLVPDAVLLVLNPREIPSCIAAIEALDIAKCWLSYMTEIEAGEFANAVINHGSASRYLVISDDAEPTQAALDKVLEVHDDDRDHVATGYCNLDSQLPLVNLTTNRLPKPPPTIESYTLVSQADVDAHGDRTILTTFAGFALTCMTRELWLDFPFAATELGGQMDYSLSYRLQQASVPIWTHRDARIHHVKQTWNQGDTDPEKRLLVGARPPQIRWS